MFLVFAACLVNYCKTKNTFITFDCQSWVISKNYACSINNYVVYLYLPFKKSICRGLTSKNVSSRAYKFVMYNEGYLNEILTFEDRIRINAKKKDDLLKLMELFA